MLPMVWFVLSRATQLRPELDSEEGEWTVYEHDWAGPEIDALAEQIRSEPAE